MKKAITGVFVAGAFAVSAATCIVSGDPIANAGARSSSAASAATALVTGALSSSSAVGALEARYRSSDVSEGIALQTKPLRSFLFLVR